MSLIPLARTCAGKPTLASYGTGTISQVAGELFKSRAGIEAKLHPTDKTLQWEVTLGNSISVM